VVQVDSPQTRFYNDGKPTAKGSLLGENHALDHRNVSVAVDSHQAKRLSQFNETQFEWWVAICRKADLGNGRRLASD